MSTPRKNVTRAPVKKVSPKPKKRRRWLRLLLVVLVVPPIAGIAIFVFLLFRTEVPTPNELATSEATVVYYADGVNEIGRLGESTRRSVSLSQIPIDVQMAVLAAEDRDFYNHGGISPVGIARAALNNVTGGSTQGGSTITQQYAKIAFLTQDRTWDRKIREALLAFKLETIISKEQILEDYLNTIYFGRNANGIEAAAIAYFGQPVNELNFEQAALLAAVIKSPSALSAEENIETLKERWAYVINSMLVMGSITPEQAETSEFPEVIEFRQKDRLSGQVGFLLTAVEQQLLTQGFDQDEIQRGGLKVFSSFNRKAQRAAQRAVRDNGPTTGTEGLRIGLAAVRPGTGEVVAMYGGKNFIDDQINNATRQFAQAGSTFKPFALAAGLEQDTQLNSLWSGDSPTTINGFTFNNYGNNSYGTVSLLEATELSINSAYVELEADIGVDNVAGAAVKAGIPVAAPGMNLDALDLTFVLGTASPSGLDLANAYATFANQGIRATTTFITKILGSNDGLLFEFDPQVSTEFSPDVANTVNYALGRVVTNGTGKAALSLERPAGGKTGTTDDNKSAWFAGYTPQLSAAVLMAKEDPSGLPISMSGTGGLDTVTGGSFPAAIWTAFMRDALKDEPVAEFASPPASALLPVECPEFIEVDLDDIPTGCPIPEILNEFEPDAGTGSGPDPVETEQIEPVLPVEPSNEFGGDPATGFEDPTLDEGRPN